MSSKIPSHHRLVAYHRRRPPFAGRTPGEITRQWGDAAIVAGLPEGGVPAGSFQTITLRYTVGSMGVDEDGGFKLAFRFVSDVGVLQTTNAAGDDYVSASTSGRATIELQSERKGTVRPFQRTLFVHVRNATLAQGDTVDVVLGDRSGGGAGWRQQTYYESPFPVRVAVDPLGTHDYHDLPFDLGWDIVPGPAARYVVNAPSFAVPGTPCLLRVKAEDAWGNPLRDLAGEPPEVIAVSPDGEHRVDGRPRHDAGVWSFEFVPGATGPHGFRIGGTDLPTSSNGMMAVASLPELAYHWCDLHGQSGETVGSGTIEEYFHFGRHYAFLDGSVHQGNDFQITPALWNTSKA